MRMIAVGWISHPGASLCADAVEKVEASRRRGVAAELSEGEKLAFNFLAFLLGQIN
jgi:hypothetical protein